MSVKSGDPPTDGAGVDLFKDALFEALASERGYTGLEDAPTVEVWRTETAGSAFANLPRSITPGRYKLVGPLEDES